MIMDYIYNFLLYSTNTIKISERIKYVTGWESDYQEVCKVYDYFLEYNSDKTYLDLLGRPGQCLRTLDPEEYFKVLEYKKYYEKE